MIDREDLENVLQQSPEHQRHGGGQYYERPGNIADGLFYIGDALFRIRDAIEDVFKDRRESWMEK